MTKKTRLSKAAPVDPLQLAIAVEQYVARGGVIRLVPEGESAELAESQHAAQDVDPEARLDLLKGLVAKGAGVSALQYSLRMNRKEIKRLATENNVKIHYSRPVRGLRTSRQKDKCVLDDTAAGHAMHYSTLGYTVPEIAQLLKISVREVLNMGKAYRFDFMKTRNSATSEEAQAGNTDSAN